MGTQDQQTIASPDQLIQLVRDSLVSPASKKIYAWALAVYFRWCSSYGRDPLTKSSVLEFRSAQIARNLASNTIHILVTAIRTMFRQASDAGFVPAEVTASLLNVRGVHIETVRPANWLSAGQVENLLRSAPETTLRGLRDRAVLAVMLTTGLRRYELPQVRVEQIENWGGRWVLAGVMRKGNKKDDLPLPDDPDWVKPLIDAWLSAAGVTDGPLFRPIIGGHGMRGRVTRQPLTPRGVAKIVGRYGERIGVPTLAPHDLRRTFADLALEGGADLRQIQLAMSHASIATTEKYVLRKKRFDHAPCDRLGVDFQVERKPPARVLHLPVKDKEHIP